MALSPDEFDRYRRQLMIPGWDQTTQQRLKEATVFVAGVGGLGSPVSMYLAVAGVGRLIVCDCDQVDLSNLNRQILHPTARVGTAKAASAAETLAALNPEIEVVTLEARITSTTVDAQVGDAHLIVDCLDNFETRYVLNDAALRKGIPLVHGSVNGLEGRLCFLQPPTTACLRCVFPAGPPVAPTPVLGATPGVIGALQAMEAIKYLTGLGETLKGRLLTWDGGTADFRSFRTQRDPRCPSCANGSAAGDAG